MKKALLVLLVLAALGGGGWYYYTNHYGVLGPRAQFERMTAAAAMGQEDLFIEGFTEDSARLMRGFLALARTYDEVSDRPYRFLVEASAVGERVEGDQAVVEIEWGRETLDVPFVKQAGRWRLDAFELEERLR